MAIPKIVLFYCMINSVMAVTIISKWAQELEPRGI